MKNFWLSLVLLIGLNHSYKSCTYYDPDANYFNLFAQETIANQAYYPFLLSYSSPYYDKSNSITLKDENIEEWQKYFNNELTYSETDALLKVIDIKHLYAIKKGKLTHRLFEKLGVSFYQRYKEGMDYIIEAKYLEPYMRVKHSNKNYSFYSDKKTKDITGLDYQRNSKALISLFNAAKNNSIKLRYGYQIVRFNHYYKKYQKAINDFYTYVEPLKKDTPIYWYALDQMAGAERGLQRNEEANYHFLQVFINSRNKKQSAYSSMKITNQNNFDDLLNQVTTKEEMNFVHFLLGYNKFNNELPVMKTIFKNDTNSDLIKVLVARQINRLERNYLPYIASCDNEECNDKKKRLPFFHQRYDPYSGDIDKSNSLEELKAFLSKGNKVNNDPFWKISLSYLEFLLGNYSTSNKLLNQINAKEPLYINQISRIKMLNDIVSQDVITPEFEIKLLTNYPSLLRKDYMIKNYWDRELSTKGFIHDILANRYLLQGEHGKSFLMNNKISELQYNPDSNLVKEVERFINKKNKNKFEIRIYQLANNVEDSKSFFALLNGDDAMRNGNFSRAIKYYENATNFPGIYRTNYDNKRIDYEKNEYDGFTNVSYLVFGHNVKEYFNGSEQEVMRINKELLFDFLEPNMNKLELAKAAKKLKDIGRKRNSRSADANQLIGNLLYNTSILGYYRHYFVMDVNNNNGPKYHFNHYYKPSHHYYYKGFGYSSSINPDDFDAVIAYYKKALLKTSDKEQKARILFQMASAEQGKFYQWDAQLPELKWDKNYRQSSKERKEMLRNKKNNHFRKYFGILKSDFSETQTVKELRKTCSYFNHYML